MADRQSTEPDGSGDRAGDGPGAAEASFVTTEHFTLQGARSSTISEATGRASMFLAAVSGGLVALGLVASATGGVGVAFYALALIILPTLAFVGLVTFHRALQSGVEDYGYAQRIARLRAYYFDHAPRLEDYLLSVPHPQRLRVQGLQGGVWQHFLTVAGMISVITAVLTGSGAGLLAGLLSSGNLIAALATGVVAATATLVVLLRLQSAAWRHAASTYLFTGE
jgi:hypothetical protein